MSSYRRQVWATLADLLQQIKAGQSPTAVSDLQEEVRKLGKTQFKANTLAETQMHHWQTTLTQLETTHTQNQTLLRQLQSQQQTHTDTEFLAALLPVVDDLEQVLVNGRWQLQKEPNPQLEGWLTGLRLTHEHLLTLLAKNHVAPMNTLRQPFDPYRHRAVGTSNSWPEQRGTARTGTIVAEERRGYQWQLPNALTTAEQTPIPSRILRFADVIVYKPTN